MAQRAWHKSGTGPITKILPAESEVRLEFRAIGSIIMAMRMQRHFLAQIPAQLPAKIRVMGLGVILAVSGQVAVGHEIAVGQEAGIEKSDAAASAWVDGEVARSRLIAEHVALSATGAPATVAWEVELDEGWKTYWRSPGEAGMPPTFSWQGSVNVGQVDLRFPLPRRFTLFNIETFGYADRLVLPIVITPQIAGAPVHLVVTVDYLVCKDICVPLEARIVLDLPVSDSEPESSAFAGIIRDSLSRVPLDAGLGLSDLEIRAVSLYGPPGNQRLTIEVAGSRLLTGADILLEAGPGVLFDSPRRALIGGGERALFTMGVGSYSSNVDLSGSDITITFSDGWGGAIEATVTIGDPVLTTR